MVHNIKSYTNAELMEHGFRPMFGHKNPNYHNIVEACRMEISRRLSMKDDETRGKK